MILTLDLAAERPLFNQIVDGVKRALVDGQLEPGAALPSGRELSGVLDVSLETVQRAYRQLAEEGIVTSRVGRGTRVVDPIDIDRLGLDSLIEELVEKARQAGVSQSGLARLVADAYR